MFPTIRQAELFVAGLDWGDARLGFGSTASYLTNEFDLSGTFDDRVSNQRNGLGMIQFDAPLQAPARHHRSSGDQQFVLFTRRQSHSPHPNSSFKFVRP